jgi:Na+-driven multidrug efflux pump
MAVVNGVNAVLSWGLVYGVGPLPALGVLGAGIGAAAGSAVGGILVVRSLLRGRVAGGLRVSRAGLRPDGARAWRLLRIGLPSGAEQGLLRLAQVVMASVVTGLGTAAYAGHQLGIQLLSVAFTPGFAFSVAATTLVGQELGRQSPQRAAACTMTASWLALGVMCSGGVAAFFLAEPLVRFFTSDPGVIAQGPSRFGAAPSSSPPWPGTLSSPGPCAAPETPATSFWLRHCRSGWSACLSPGSWASPRAWPSPASGRR